MDSSPNPTIVFPVNLGEASNYNRDIFRFSYRKRDNLGRGDLFLDATLDEMLKIMKIGVDPLKSQELLRATRDRYDRLLERRAEIERRPKSKNPFILLLNYRAARMFLSASQSLYIETKTRSEDLLRLAGRSLLTFPGEDLQPLNEDPPPNASVVGIAVRLDRPLDDAIRQQISDASNTIVSCTNPPEADSTVQSDAMSFLSDSYLTASESMISLVTGATLEEEEPDMTTSPTSPSSSSTPIINNTYNIIGSVFAPYSIVQGATGQFGGEQNSGSVIHTVTPPQTTLK